MSSHLFLNGVLHSVSDPYATAVLVVDGVVAWLGSDESAAHVAGDEVPITDLDGAVLTPAFTEPGVPEEDAAGALGRGAAVTTVLARDAGSAAHLRRGLTPVRAVVHRPAGAAPEADAAGVWAGVGEDASAAELTELLIEATARGEQVLLSLTADAGPAAQQAALAALRATAERLGEPALGLVRHRLGLTAAVGEQDRTLLAATSTAVTVAPDASGTLHAPLGSLLAAGVPVCLASGPHPSPWAAVRAGLEHPDPAERVTARSAFTAATRTGLRALPDVPAAAVEAAPRLVVGAPATFALWRADAVAVQSPDTRVAAWSTDTRAGTPLLPALEAGAPLPTWLGTWVDGEQAADPEHAAARPTG
ncbi:hypothetical protein [Micrococcus sp.]|uniref:hypothetical protein n=1 Tax=Micrococcus sp. TaxID=1271 RepID=UPI002A911B20|nr:hypothetical protein [Micrococcus sp.]MDY6055410.1 hypothetical protein [Micrococcus sp.]